MRTRVLFILLIPLLLGLSTLSCSSTRHLAEDEVLLKRNQITDQGELPKESYRNYIKQKPNKRVFGWKFWLTLYNLAGEERDNGINRWLRRIGEPPVAYSPDLQANSAEQLELYLFNKGYFNAQVKDTAIIKRKKAKVLYDIQANKPYTIRNIDYFFQDGSISKYVMSDSVPKILRPGTQYDYENFNAENVRIEEILKNQGYYRFSRNYIYYEVDSSLNNHKVDVTMGVRNFSERDQEGRAVRKAHPIYTIRNVTLKTSKSLVEGDPTMRAKRDTIQYSGITLVADSMNQLNPGLITQKNFILPGARYNARRASQTRRNLASLSAVKLVDINFSEVDREQRLLDCEINLIPAVRQAFTGSLEGTTSGGNIGAAGNINYQHRNLFGGSEKFDITLLGAIENIPPNPEVEEEGIETMQELGAEINMEIPQFLLPFRTEQFIRRYNPETNINLNFNYQLRPRYTRSIFKTSFGYRWRGNRYLTHYVFPFEISLIQTPRLRDDFVEWLEGTYLFYSYQPHIITNQRYRLIFTNQNLNKPEDFQYLRFGLETSGNLLYSAFNLLNAPKNEGEYQIRGIGFAQYVRADIDARNYTYFGEGNSFVLRGFVGASVPYLNSTAIPFEKQFFGGGANSIRAWRVKDLGPGSSARDTVLPFPNQTADLKIEFNAELRFDLFWKMEGALFVDAGNIWSLSKEEDREGAIFELNDFYREIAVGTGFGLRLDFNFFLFRFDLGIPLVDPSLPLGARWIPGNKSLVASDLGYNIAIGYPF